MKRFLFVLLVTLPLFWSCGNNQTEESSSLSDYELEIRAREMTDSILKATEMGLNRTPKDEAYADSVEIVKAWISSPNSAGGFEVHVGFRNKSQKVIKYATIRGRFYNAVDDPIETDYETSFNGKETGPINPGKTNNYSSQYWGLYYSWQVKYLKLYEIDIEYMDGTKVEVPIDYTTRH